MRRGISSWAILATAAAGLTPATALADVPAEATSETGLTLDQDMLTRLPLSRPDARGGAVRSFESVAALTPGARDDDYGVSINGATSPENRYLVDGLSVNDPAYGIAGTPLSLHFVEGSGSSAAAIWLNTPAPPAVCSTS